MSDLYRSFVSVRRIPSPGRAAKIARKLGEPEAFWIKLALQDLLRKEKNNLAVSVARNLICLSKASSPCVKGVAPTTDPR